MRRWFILLCVIVAMGLLTLSVAGTEATEPTQTVAATEPVATTEAAQTGETETFTEATEATESIETTEVTESTEVTEPSEPRPEPKNEDERIRYQIEDIHKESLKRAEKDSFAGYCGLEVSWELYLLGINSYLQTMDGNAHYDYYSALDTTTGGYLVKSYDAEEYSLRKALNTITCNGTRNVYNIMVGFEKTTTEAGQIYGHVTMIHAILNGNVYFVEGFATPYTAEEGIPIVVTIDEFIEYWKGWTEYEGLVYFGTKDPLAIYDGQKTDLFIQCDLDTPVYQLPEQGASLRTAARGERLHANGIYEDGVGGFYYRIDDDGETGFVPSGNVSVLRLNFDAIQISDLKVPEVQKEGKFFYHGGKVSSDNLVFENVYITIFDLNDTVVMEGVTQMRTLANWSLWNQVDFRQLPIGCYNYTVSADVVCTYISGDELVQETQRTVLARHMFTVGNVVQPKQNEETVTYDGWVYLDGTWYCYDQGQPRSGWLCNDGVDYYLQEDGSVTTGWLEINGHLRCFTQTGALRTGWIYLQDGTKYLLRNGICAVGWKTVDGARYLFDEEGFLRQDGWVKLDDKLYFLDENGQAAVGWVDLPEGRFSFHADGYLLSVWEDGQVVDYDGQWDPTEVTDKEEK